MVAHGCPFKERTLLVASLLLVVWPGATSSVLAPSRRCPLLLVGSLVPQAHETNEILGLQEAGVDDVSCKLGLHCNHSVRTGTSLCLLGANRTLQT